MAPLLNRAWVTAALGLGVNEDYRSNPDTKLVALQSFIVNREQAASRRFATKVEEDEKRTAPLASSSSSSSSSPSLLGFDALGENAPIRRLVLEQTMSLQPNESSLVVINPASPMGPTYKADMPITAQFKRQGTDSHGTS